MSSLDTSIGLVDEARTGTLFCSSSRLTVLDHFRVPYEIDPQLASDGIEQLRVAGNGPVLLWSKVGTAGLAGAANVLGADQKTSVPVFARILSDSVVEPLLAERGGTWRRAREVTTANGGSLGSIWLRDDGSVFLPFDPDEVLLNYWSERYLEIASSSRFRHLRKSLMHVYYRTRPLLPRVVQIWLRRRFARVQARTVFPRYPIESCVQDFCQLTLAILGGIAGGPIPYIAPWPNGYSWALVLTHDVEQAEGVTALDPVLELERARGLRSSWNFVPKRYDVDPELVSELVAEGFEVGVHGLHHDGRDLASLEIIQERLPGIREAAERWGAVGFRAPALHRHWDWMQMMGFDYDSSCPDTDPFEPQDGGCCTWFPFFNGELVELPLTIQQDHTVFVILRRDETFWVEKAEFLRDRGGLGLINTHPDYLVDRRILDGYARFLDHFAEDETAWKALPREVSAWWRRRAASSLEWDGDTWRIAGPAAAEGQIEFDGGSW